MDPLILLSEEPISSLFPLPLRTARPDQSVREAVAIMRAAHAGCVLVCHQDQLVGLFTERDLLRRLGMRLGSENVELGQSQALDVPLSTVVSTDRRAVYEHDSVRTAIRLMSHNQCRHLPVLDPASVPIGILSVKRIVREIVESMPSTIYNLRPTPNPAQRQREGA